MIKRVLVAAALLALIALAAIWLAIRPRGLAPSDLASVYRPDLANGEVMFNAGNCSACHATPGQDDRKQLGGGVELASTFGVFVAPNISADRKFGIGAWSQAQFANAMKRGVGARGEHLYPAFPYPAYSAMKTSDLLDLFAYLKTLPPVERASAPHRLKFPYGVRAAVGVWKRLHFRPREFQPDPRRSAAWNRGAYLAEGPAHCAECHTPRGALGAMKAEQRYAGAPNLEAGGRFASNITPSKDGVGDWSEADIASFLKTGLDKCFNEPTGMRQVTAATSRLPDADIAAIAAYIHALPPLPGAGDHKTC